MPNQGDFGSSELHKTVPGGERVLIRRLRPEDIALYPDFLADVSAEPQDMGPDIRRVVLDLGNVRGR
jgi:hypothetical protein